MATHIGATRSPRACLGWLMSKVLLEVPYTQQPQLLHVNAKHERESTFAPYLWQPAKCWQGCTSYMHIQVEGGGGGGGGGSVAGVAGVCVCKACVSKPFHRGLPKATMAYVIHTQAQGRRWGNGCRSLHLRLWAMRMQFKESVPEQPAQCRRGACRTQAGARDGRERERQGRGGGGGGDWGQEL